MSCLSLTITSFLLPPSKLDSHDFLHTQLKTTKYSKKEKFLSGITPETKKGLIFGFFFLYMSCLSQALYPCPLILVAFLEYGAYPSSLALVVKYSVVCLSLSLSPMSFLIVYLLIYIPVMHKCSLHGFKWKCSIK